MKPANCFLGVGLLALLLTGTVWATELQQPAAVRQLSHEFSLFEGDSAQESTNESPSDAPQEAVDAGTNGGDSCCPSETGCGSFRCRGSCRGSCGGCCLGDPWTLPQPCFLQRRGFKVGGWVQQGITFNGHNPTSGFNGPVGTNDWDSEYQMNQLWVYLTKPVNTGGYGWDIGGHVDMIYGSDWRFGINQGLEDRINSLGNSYGLVIPQFYLELGVNNLSVKFGHFAGILDYEAVPAVLNPFYSHSLSYGFTVPQLVTGLLADYKLSNQLSVLGGFHRGWMKFEDNNDELDVMAGIKWVSADQWTSLTYAISSGAQDPAGAQDRFVYSLVAKRKLSEKFEYVAVHNLGAEDGTGPNGTDAEWYGLNQYFLYTINPRWSAKLRFEWLRDDDGAIVHGPPAAAGIRAWPGGGFAGNFYELTAGLSWKPHANVLIRPECRWDWYDGLPGPGYGLPYNDGASDDQFTFAVDAIVTF